MDRRMGAAANIKEERKSVQRAVGRKIWKKGKSTS
jgi:hypothetical protein